MRESPNVVIVLGRCQREGQLFGVRLEEAEPGRWVADWAFGVNEKTARRERFDRGEVRGTFDFAADYPGCPGCRAAGLFVCSCGKVGCWDGESKKATCPWCRRAAHPAGQVDRLWVGGDA